MDEHRAPLRPAGRVARRLPPAPAGEVWLGIRDAGTEVPERATVILTALTAAGAAIVPPRPHDPAALLAVHDAALIEHLATIWADWDEAGYPDRYGRDRVVPYVFPTAALLAGQPARVPAAVHARPGLFCYDTMTLVGPGSWEAITTAADCARTAADLVAEGAEGAYALCRPPGHHAGPAGYGGSCYLNNAAIAAAALRRAGTGRVAIIDIDAHHGNGTQSIFYARADVLYGSVHVDPGAGWFPHYLGFADETGTGPATGPTGTSRWRRAAETARGWPRCASCARRRGRSEPAPWCCPWAWTPPPPTRRARCR